MSMRLETQVVTKTASCTGTPLDMGEGYSVPMGFPLRVGIRPTAVSRTNGDEVYSFVAEESDDGVTYTACTNQLSVTEPGFIRLDGSSQMRYLRYRLTMGGTSPSITFGDIYVQCGSPA